MTGQRDPSRTGRLAAIGAPALVGILFLVLWQWLVEALDVPYLELEPAFRSELGELRGLGARARHGFLAPYVLSGLGGVDGFLHRLADFFIFDGDGGVGGLRQDNARGGDCGGTDKKGGREIA